MPQDIRPSLGRPQRTVGRDRRVRRDASAIYGVVPIGTAQAMWTLAWMYRMAEARLLDRVNWVICGDWNPKTHGIMKAGFDELQTVWGYCPKLILPEFLPTGNGFSENPWGWLEWEGDMVDDMDRCVRDARQHSDEIGVTPTQIIWGASLAGHAFAGCAFLPRVREKFNRAYILPVVIIPKDSGLRKQLREKRVFETVMSSLAPDCTPTSPGIMPSLIIDNDVVGQDEVDVINQGIALFGASFDATSRTSNQRSLVDHTVGMTFGGARYLGLGVTVEPLLPSWYWTVGLPPRKVKVKDGRAGEVDHKMQQAIEASGFPNAQFGHYDMPAAGTICRVVCAAPISAGVLTESSTRVNRWFETERFWDANPDMSLMYVPVRFPSSKGMPEDGASIWRRIWLRVKSIVVEPGDDLQLVVTRLTALNGNVASLMDLLERGDEKEHEQERRSDESQTGPPTDD